MRQSLIARLWAQAWSPVLAELTQQEIGRLVGPLANKIEEDLRDV
jgi:hypothetical protein